MQRKHPDKSLPAEAMETVNKLIFVQDFEQASSLLEQFSRSYPEDYEIQFRRVEVCYKTGDLSSLVEEFHTRSQENPESLALQLAWTLAEVRNLERASAAHNEEVELLNPSLSSGAERDVFGLSLDAERVSQSRLASAVRVLSPAGATAGWIPSTNERGFRINRHPAVADDAVAQELPPAPAAFADMEPRNVADPAEHDSSTPECIWRAHSFVLENPENYAVWYVKGCALEYMNELNEAVEAWTKAAELAPRSISVLATMAELQQMGVVSQETADYSLQFESLDKYLVHGSLETHVALYQEFLANGEYAHAIAALRTLADWIQRQRGDVPPEIEILCLLGAMKAYRLGSNENAAEACKRQATTLARTIREAPRGAAQLKFAGEICQQFGLDREAQQCYVALVKMSDATIDVITQVTSHSIAIGVGEPLREALREAYRNHRGAAEIRFCQVLTSLALADAPARSYAERKGKIRELLGAGDVGAAYPLVKQALQEIQDDAEIHYYMAELLTRFGVNEQAETHFKKMFELDYYNVDSTIRYGYFLLKNGNYETIREVVGNTLKIEWLQENQVAELRWELATACFAQGDNGAARNHVECALKANPWNGAYLTLGLRLLKPNQPQLVYRSIQSSTQQEPTDFALARELEEAFVNKEMPFLPEHLHHWLEHGRATLLAGYCEYAFLLAKSLLLIHHTEESVVDFFTRAGAANNSRGAVQELLMLQHNSDLNIPLAHIALFAARIYNQSGEWALADEWSDISMRSGLEDRFFRSKLLEMEALRLTLQGTNLRRAQNLLEAAIDVYESERKTASEAGVLHGYLLVIQGEIRRGLEKIQNSIGEDPSIQNLYFLIKVLERCGSYPKAREDSIARMFQKSPTNILERRFIEEIFCTVGADQKGMPVRLTC